MHMNLALKPTVLLQAFIIIALFLSSASFASCISNATNIILTEQGTNIIAVVMFTIVLIACAYMAGSFLSNANYTVFAKDELYHLGFSLVLLVAFSGVVVFSCYLSDYFYSTAFPQLLSSSELAPLPASASSASGCYTVGAGLGGVSNCYVQLIERDARKLSESYIEKHVSYLMDSTFSWNIQIPLFNSYTTTAGAYKRIISNQYDIIVNSFILPAVVSISMQKLALDFINENAIRWLLPAAFVLRIFIPTRQMGNMLIAFVLGIYVLVPFMYVFNFSMYDAVLSSCPDYASAVCDNAVDSYGCGDPTASLATCGNPDSFWNVARLIPQAFFLPNLTLAVLITFLSGMNKALRVVG